MRRGHTRRGIVEVISDDSNDEELEAAKARLPYFQGKGDKLRHVEGNPQNYRLSAGGYLAEIDRMNFEVREHLLLHPSEFPYQVA